jgi:transposase InsO family protein
MLVELSVMEQRYHAVMEVISGAPVTEVARRYGVSRQAVHGWLGRYERDGLTGLADHSHRPAHQPRQLDAEIEALICQWRGAHPRWGPRRLLFELGKARVSPLPSRSTIYRVLVRHALVPARKRKRRRQDYKRWQREEPMQLWQLDVTGSVFLADGTELKLISGLDDCSRYCVIAEVVRRATARAVCRAFVAAMAVYGIPDEVLTNNGKVFTGRFGKPRPAEVLFERICRKNGIKQLLAKPYSPTTIGKVERWHQTLQTDFLTDAGPFASIEDAQDAVDGWRHEYNHDRPHQSLDMATPASRFRPSPPQADEALSLWAPADLEPLTTPAPASDDTRTDAAPASWPDAVEVDRIVPPSGNMTVGPQQFWLGTARAGQKVTIWIDATSVHLSIGGWRIKTVPSRLSGVDLARLRRTDGRPRRPAARWPLPWCAGRVPVRGGGPAGQRHRRHHVVEPADPGRLPAGRAAGPPAPRRPADARPHPRRGAVAHPALPHPTRPTSPPAGGPPGRARTTARGRSGGAAAGVLPRRHPGRLPAHPGGDDPRGQDRHCRHREQHLPAGHRRRHRRHRAPHHQPPDRPLQGPRHPPQKAVTPCPK